MSGLCSRPGPGKALHHTHTARGRPCATIRKLPDRTYCLTPVNESYGEGFEMLPPKTRAFLLLGWVAICSPQPVFSQDTAASKPRELKIPGTDGQPSLSVRIWAEGQQGLVAVRGEKRREGAKAASVPCPPAPRPKGD